MKRTLALLALCLVTAAQSFGATSPGPDVQRMTLKEAIKTALEQNHRIKAAGFSAMAANQGVAIATSHYYPAIFFEESFAASNAPTQTFMMKLDQGRFSQGDFLINNLNHPSAHQDFKSSLTIQQPLYTPSTAPLRQMALKDAEKGALEQEGARQNIAFQTFQIYLEAQKSAAQRSAAEEAISEAREHLRLAKVRNGAGVGLKSDELRARTHLATMESQLITANNNLALAEMRLAMVAGLTSGSRIKPAETFAGFSGTFQTRELLSTAMENRSDLRHARAELEKSESAVKLARSAYLPSLATFASYQMNAEHVPFGNDNDAWAAGIRLNWQLFDGFRRGHEQDRASAQRSAAAEALEQSQREADYQVRESLLRRDEMEKRREVARHALQDAEETVRLLSRRFENSLATMTDLLDAQSALNQTRANLVEAEANYALSGGQVFYSSGQFLKEMTK